MSVAGRSDHETISFGRATRSVAANARQASRVWDEKSAANIAKDAIFAVFDTDGSALSEAAAFVEPFFPRAMLGADQDAAKDVLAGREVAMLVPTDTGMSLLAAIELLDTRRGAEIGDQAMDAMLRSTAARAWLGASRPRRSDASTGRRLDRVGPAPLLPETPGLLRLVARDHRP